MYKRLKQCLSVPLTMLYNQTLSVGYMPPNWHAYNGIIHPAQHGFVKQHSTCTNLLESFDVVSHNKLFARLYSYGIRGSILLWLKKFLTGRTFQTRVGSSLSEVA